MAAADSLALALRSPSLPLPATARSAFQANTGLALPDDVRLHDSLAAAESAHLLGARAYTYGTHIVFGHDAYAPRTATGAQLLQHELAHVRQQQQGEPIVQRQQRTAHAAAFDPLLQAFGRNLEALEAFIAELETVPDQTASFIRELANLRLALADIRSERAATQRFVEQPLPRARRGGTDEQPAPETVDAQVRQIYFARGVVNTSNITIRRGQLERGITLVETIRLRVLNLINGIPADASAATRSVALDVASYYMQVATMLEDDARVQLAFLDTYYQDETVLQLYAVVRHAQLSRSDIVHNVRLLQEYAGTAITAQSSPWIPGPFPTPNLTGDRPVVNTQRQSMALRDDIYRYVDLIGDPPRRVEAIHARPTAAYAANLSAQLAHLNALIAVLALWIPVEQMEEELGRSLYAGTSLIPGEDDRTRWFREIQALEDAFTREASQTQHTDLQTRVDGWEPRVQRLVRDIPPELRRRQIMAAVAEQIPFLIVGGGIAGGVGRFVGLVTRGSRWLIALAEGVTLTALGALATPRASQPTSVGGWALQLAANVAWARIGRALFEAGAAAAQGMSSTRNVLARVGVQVVAPTVAIASMQTLVQAIEAQAQAAGGETNITELLTVNLIMNALGVLTGAAMNVHASGSGARPTAAQLARRANITEEAAQRWLDLAQRSDSFAENMQRLQQLARAGTLTPEQFEAMKVQGRALADEVERVLPGLSETLGLGQTPEQISGAMNAFRQRLASLTYTPRPRVTALLPEYTQGLARANEATFFYDAANPPRQLAALRQAFVNRGYTVRDRPGGGFEVLDAGGRRVAQILPAGRGAIAALPRSLSEEARGPQAQEGLARVRAQTADSLLESLLAQAAARDPASVVPVLRALGRFISPTDTDAWAGLSNYLRRGGSLRVLHRVLSRGASVQESAEATQHAQRVLRQMARWGDSAVRGLGVLYEVRPNTSSERISNLFFDFEPAQVKGIFEAIDRLAPVSRGLGRVLGPLTSGDVAQQRGAMGSLTTAVQLANEHPNAIIAFEEPVFEEGGRLIRVQDINVIERQTTRVAGVETTTEMTVASFEVKEISTASLGRRGPHQLAIDIVLDSLARSRRVAPVGAQRPFFETFRWRIRRTELAQRAARNLGITDTADPHVEPEMRRIVEGMLRSAFDDPALNGLSASERDGYRRAFTGVPFVEFF